MRLISRFAIATVFLVLLSACRTSETTSVVVSDGALLGSLRGVVSAIVDSLGHKPADLSGVDISIDGMSKHTVSNDLGAWQIDSLPPVNSSVTASLAGFDPIHIRDIKLVAGAANILGTSCSFIQPPKFVPQLEALIMPTASAAGTLYGHFSGSVSAGVVTNLFVIVSHRRDLHIEDPQSYEVSYTVPINPYPASDTTRNFTYGISATGNTVSKAKTGDTISLRVYPYYLLVTEPDGNGGSKMLGYGQPSNVLSGIKN